MNHGGNKRGRLKKNSSMFPTPKWIKVFSKPDSDDERYVKTVPSEDSENNAKDGMQYINIEVHPYLLDQPYLRGLRGQEAKIGFKLTTSNDLGDNILRWTRNVPRTFTNNSGKVMLTESRHDLRRCLYITTAEDVAEILANDEQGLAVMLNATLQTLGHTAMTVIIMGAQKYFKTKGPIISEDQLNMALMGVIVGMNVDSELCESDEELHTLIVQMSKAFAEMPSKMAKRNVDEMADFYMRGDKKDCVVVDAEGNGLEKLWQQMLTVLPQSSLETSRAVAAKYISPRVLAEAMRTEAGVAELADVGVARSTVPGARARRVGPEMANTLRILATQPHGDMLVGKSSDDA